MHTCIVIIALFVLPGGGGGGVAIFSTFLIWEQPKINFSIYEFKLIQAYTAILQRLKNHYPAFVQPAPRFFNQYRLYIV